MRPVIFQEKIKWDYPLKGIAQYINTDSNFRFKTKARKVIEEELEFILEGLNSHNLKNEKFEI